MRAVGERIRTLLEKKGMTQKQLAHAAGCTEAAVSHYIKGDHTPRSDVMAKIAAVLGTTTNFLAEGIPQNKTDEVNYAKKLIARNVDHMTREEKLEIIEMLLR